MRVIISAVFWVLTVVIVAVFVARAWTPARGSGGVRSREVLVRAGIDAVVLLAVVRALFPPPVWASWLWVGAAVAVGVGVAGVIVGWHRQPSSRRRWPTVLYAVVGAGLVVVLA